MGILCSKSVERRYALIQYVITNRSTLVFTLLLKTNEKNKRTKSVEKKREQEREGLLSLYCRTYVTVSTYHYYNTTIPFTNVRTII